MASPAAIRRSVSEHSKRSPSKLMCLKQIQFLTYRRMLTVQKAHYSYVVLFGYTVFFVLSTCYKDCRTRNAYSTTEHRNFFNVIPAFFVCFF